MPPFVDGEVYTKFGVYALLNHGGDHRAAAREVSRLGFGSQPSAQAPRAGSARSEPPEMGPHPADRPQTDGSSALAPVVKISGRQCPEPLTELGFARRLVDKHGEILKADVALKTSGGSEVPILESLVCRLAAPAAR